MNAPRTVPDADVYRPPPDTGLEVLHVEDAFVVLVKPAGLLSEPGRGLEKRDSLLTRAQAVWPGARIVHRLDMPTSGVIVLAREALAHASLSEAFREREVDKVYEALVHGRPARDEGEIDLPLIVDWPNRPRQVVCHDTGKPSLTHYRVVGETRVDGVGTLTRIALAPVTGRTHQLRVHLASLGCPIAGDPFYGIEGDVSPRMMLHACRLALPHTLTGEPLVFESPVPF
ncbi:RluA family pseudouridine synthase [Scleromatobacter humisilvae]|uniref:RluA family pseudouridine synthase n=1 Tax=Scleromatobacter humisilvae TaxID=2897159 RepID=A0A9X1YDN4_9BURK|nr:RluA family pseudouridine synthase [Scleromatobacter humisilvae]MCK9684239.1 RluA family pseudouridine synthase [Scleromatobacter humisilvae]